MQRLGHHLRAISAQAILERAQEVLGSVVHPSERRRSPLDEVPSGAESVELDLEETIEGAPFLARQGWSDPADLWMEYSLRRQQPVVLAVDTSLSMTGEKLALTAVALAVVLLQFPDDSIGSSPLRTRPGSSRIPTSGSGYSSWSRGSSMFRPRVTRTSNPA